MPPLLPLSRFLSDVSAADDGADGASAVFDAGGGASASAPDEEDTLSGKTEEPVVEDVVVSSPWAAGCCKERVMMNIPDVQGIKATSPRERENVWRSS